MKKIVVFIGVLLLLTGCTKSVTNSVTVFFETNGGSSIAEVITEKGSLVTEPVTPTKEGHTFEGWYEDSDLMVPFNFSEGVQMDKTIYGKWDVNSYELSFVDEDGMLLQEGEYDFGLDLSSVVEPSPEKEGYTFTGWDMPLPNTMPANDVILRAQFTINSYQVIFKDFDDSVISTTSYQYGSDLTSIVEPQPEREGYAFTGWNSTIPSQMPTNDVILYAEYTIQLYTLTFLDDDLTVLYKKNFYYQASLSEVSVSEPTKFGHTFASWSDDIPSQMPSHDVTLTAQYTANQYAISFYDYDSSLIDELLLDYETDFLTVETPEPTRLGYTFTGWHSPLPDYMPAHSLTYYATYAINEYNIQYLDYDEDILFENSYAYESNLDAISVNEPSRYGYMFDGWDDILPETMPANDIIIHAQYVANTHMIRFYDYDDSLLLEESYAYDTDLTSLVEPTPNRLGYTFLAWDNTIPTTMPNESISLVATYSIITYQITYELYEGQNGVNPNTYTIESDSIVLNQPTKTGYTFMGWYDNDGFTGAPMTEISFGSTGDVILHAKWQIISYPIMYVLDDGINGVNPENYQIVSETIVLDDATKTGYTFMGWYDNDGFIGNPITEISSGSTGEITLYAKWEVHQHELTYITFDDYNPLTDISLAYGEEVIAIALGEAHTIALTSDGNIVSWGFNLYGQLGDTMDIERSYPKDVSAQFGLIEDEKIVSISAGDNCSMVLTSLGRVFTFGENTDGQLGDGTTTYKNVPTEITLNFGLSTEEVITSIYMGGDNAAAITSLGRVFAWGNNNQGQLGNGTHTNSSLPIDITSQFSFDHNEHVLKIAIANKHYLLYTSNHRVFSWGNNSSGQIGNGSITSVYTPLDITSQFSFSDGEEVIDIATGSLHSALVTSTGRLFTWGENMYGQLGDDTLIDKNVPTDITLAFMYEFAFNEKINHVSLSEFNTVITTSFGRVYAWGRNNQGQVGDGTLYQRKSPVEITSFFNLASGEHVIFIASGKTHHAALTSTTKVFAWGYNANGQLGDGSTTRSTSPVQLAFVGVYDETTLIMDYGVSITPYTPIRTGYTLDSWYIDEACTTAYVFSTMPDDDLTLYGKWISNE